MELPQALHSQLYLLSYDRQRHRLGCHDDEPLLGFALRSAMLTDLYLSGHLSDRGGRAYTTEAEEPAHPLLCSVFEQAQGREWEQLIADSRRRTARLVRDELTDAGWLLAHPCRKLGLIPATRVALHDEDMVELLDQRIDRALLNAMQGSAAEPRLLAIGLIATLGQIPAVFALRQSAHHRAELHDLILCTIEPLLALHRVIERHYSDLLLSDRWDLAHGGE